MLAPSERRELLELARQSIAESLRLGVRAPWPEHSLSGVLAELRATFVTLHLGDRLRGCCGTLTAARPLAQDVWFNAWASAFQDPRFAPLQHEEFPQLRYHISVLEPAEPLHVASERELLSSLRPGVDGLVLDCGPRRATFLPSVWEQLHEPIQFVQQLKVKAGLPRDYWSSDIRVSRYGTESFGDEH